MSLFIGGLPWDCSEEDIRQAFAKVGLTMVSARIPRNEASGKARGHSFVEMASQEEAQREFPHQWEVREANVLTNMLMFIVSASGRRPWYSSGILLTKTMMLGKLLTP